MIDKLRNAESVTAKTKETEFTKFKMVVLAIQFGLVVFWVATCTPTAEEKAAKIAEQDRKAAIIVGKAIKAGKVKEHEDRLRAAGQWVTDREIVELCVKMPNSAMKWDCIGKLNNKRDRGELVR